MRASAQSEHFARQLFQLSLVDGRVSDERVTAKSNQTVHRSTVAPFGGAV